MGPFKTGQPLTDAERARDAADKSMHRPRRRFSQNYNTPATTASIRRTQQMLGERDDNQPNVPRFLMEDDRRTLRLIDAETRCNSHRLTRQTAFPFIDPLPMIAAE